MYSAISRGTEFLVFRGEVPLSEFERMRAPHQAGEFSFPVKYGYCSVGVVEGGNEAWLGKRVFCLYPHQDRYVVDCSAVTLVPDNVPSQRAVLAANMETAINGVWDARLCIGDRIAVVGAGVVGCLVAYLAARTIGCEVELVDIDGDKQATAAALGIGFALVPGAQQACDRVFHTSGAPAGLQTALELAGVEASVIEMSWFGTQQVPLGLGGGFHSQRLRILASQVGTLPEHQGRRWDYGRRLRLALRLLADPTLDVLLAPERRFEELPGVMTDVTAPGSATLCQRIVYE